VDGAGNLYVADTANFAIRKITPVGSNWVVSTIFRFAGTNGLVLGAGTNLSFAVPLGIALDTAGNLYVAEPFEEVISKLTPAGTNWVLSPIAGNPGIPGSADGTGTNAQFKQPSGLAVDGTGNIYVADYVNCTIREISPVGTNWMVLTIAGSAGVAGSSDGTGSFASFNYPASVVVTTNGNLIVADQFNNEIRLMTPGFSPIVGTTWSVTTVAGTAGSSGETNGTGTNATFDGPTGVALDSSGNIYVGDSGSMEIRKITPAYVVSTLAGTTGSIGPSDGTGSTARFWDPSAVAVDNAGNIYVADYYNCTIRKITSVRRSRPLS
jgi:hypothetical protein